MNDDRLLTCLALLGSALFAWLVLGGRVPVAPASATPPADERVATVAEAIAKAEGYYARGDHDGRSLLFRLNNPGGLKNPALGAETLPTWKDTGLVLFPTAEMGWAALRHQVRLMLTGRSRVYELTDTLLLVGVKYADGDVNWGWNVAGHLGVSPDVSLGDLAPLVPAP
jgi:hypothetical protein